MRKDIIIKLISVEFSENGTIEDKFIVEIKDTEDGRSSIYKIPINGEIRIKNYLETGIEVDV